MNAQNLLEPLTTTAQDSLVDWDAAYPAYDAVSFYIPSCHNAIESAIFQLSIGNQERAITFLRGAQRALGRAKDSLIGS